MSILKRTYENLMRMMFVSRSTSCMILIRRLDKLLGPNSMNLERNWSHCINWKLVNVKRKKAKRCTVLCIRYYFHEIQQYRFHLETESESIGLKNMKNFVRYHLTAMDRIHSLSEASIMRAIAIERRLSDGSDFT